MAKYAVLRHSLPENSQRADHFDLLLEDDGVLATWQIQNWPPVEFQPAKRLPDHRMLYLEFEGDVRDLGHVQRVCSGTFTVRHQSEQRWILELTGLNFEGVLRLKQESSRTDPQRWTLSVVSDAEGREASSA